MADVVLVSNTGLGIITNRIKGGGSEPKYLGWGTGTTPPLATNTGLQTPAPEARAAGTSSQYTIDKVNDTYQVVATLTCQGSAKTISEIGLFDAVAAGNLFVRGTFTGIPLNVDDAVQFTINTKFNQA
jgi:hypothetical protein